MQKSKKEMAIPTSSTLSLPEAQPNTVEIIYNPQPKQELFHDSQAKYRLYIGAWRAGKTYSGCMEALELSFRYPGNRGLIGRKDFTDLRDTTVRTFFDVCPEKLIHSYNKTEHSVVLKTPGVKSEILFRELKDGSGLGSLNLGFFYIDEAEEVEEQIFERLKGRLSLKTVGRQCGFLTSNPPNEDHWLFRQFELNKDPDFATFHASTYENKQYLPDGYIESLEKLPPSWRKKYLEGQYGFTPDGQPYYAGYIEAIHKRAVDWDNTLPLYCGWDFGYRKPAFVVTQVDRQGRWKIIYELMGGGITIDKFVDVQVMPLLNMKFKGANCVHFGDPACHQVNDKSEFTSYQILQSKGIQITCKPSEYRLRKELIEKKINTLTDGFPLLVVDPGCRIINDGFLGGYHYPIHKPDQQYTDKHDQPFHDDFYSHLMNSIEYIAINVFSPVAVNRQPRKPLPKMSRDNI
jgi:hypothetical protein